MSPVPVPCPLCGRVYCDHEPEERAQPEEQMMGDKPIERRPHFVSESCGSEKCAFVVNLRPSPVVRCGKPAKHKLGEEDMHDDPRPPHHNLTSYVCCEHYVRVVGPAALVYNGCYLSEEIG